jgi:hypothetical protein
VTPESDDRLLAHLAVEFRDPGRRAVEYLRTAGELVAGDLHASPRLPETVAYCLREAMVALLDAAPAFPSPGRWRDLSRAAVKAKARYDLAVAGTPGQDVDEALDGLLASLERIDEFHRAEVRGQQQMVAVIVDWTGSEPLAGVDIARQYQKLLERVQGKLHGDLTAEGAVALHGEVMAILRRAFTPGEVRFEQLEALALLDAPGPADIEILGSLLVTPEHLRRFCRAMSSPGWLVVLQESSILGPPLDGYWAAGAAVDALAATHPAEVAQWLEVLYGRVDGAEQAWRLVRAALDVGPLGRPLILQAVQDHGRLSGLRMLAHQSLQDTDPADTHVDELAQLLLPAEDDTYWLGQLATKLIDGVNADNAASRLAVIAKAIDLSDPQRRSWQTFAFDRGGSIAEHTLDDPHDREEVHVAAIVKIIATSLPLLGHDHVLGVVDELPSELADRLRPLVLNAAYAAEQIGLDVLLDELVAAVGTREPSGDDLPLVEAVLASDPPTDVKRLADALPSNPSIDEIATALREHTLTTEWIRTYHWLGLLPPKVQGAWADPYAVLCADFGVPGPERLRRRRQVISGWGRSAHSADELGAMDPLDAAGVVAAWRPDPNEFMVGATELARAFEAAAIADPERFFAQPFQVATRLREPIHIEHYLRGAKKAIEEGATPPIGDLLKIADLVRAQPWAPANLARHEHDLEFSWAQPAYAMVELLGAIAVKGSGFDGRDDDVFELLRDATLDRTQDSWLTNPDDALTAAINRPCTTALASLIGFMSHELDQDGKIRPEAFEVMDRVLRLEGADGAQHRAVIAVRLGWFAAKLPDWLELNAELLFGSGAPDGLGQETVDLALQWSRTNRLLLTRFPEAVRDAVVRGVEHSLDHLLIGNLWNVPGYDSDDLVPFLAGHSDLLSKAGEVLGRLARGAIEPDALAAAAAFWRAAIAAGPEANLAGFGWMSMISAFDDDLWADLTRQTQQANKGVLDWADRVSKRAGAMTPSTTTLGIFDDLVRYTPHAWDRQRAGRNACDHLGAAEQLASTPEHRRLRAALLERGYL